MTTNPFTEKLKELRRESNKESNLLQEWETKLEWFQGFNLDQANNDLRRTERMRADAQAGLEREQQVLPVMTSSVKNLEPQASMGFDPRYWFSSERAIAKRQLEDAQKRLSIQLSKVSGIEIDISKAEGLCREMQGLITTARMFDPLLAQSAVVALRESLNRFKPQMEKLRQHRDDLDLLLEEPLASLRKLEEERGRLNRQIASAEAFESELRNAPNGYERAKIHTRCQNELGDRKPGAVLGQIRSALRRVDDKVEKLQARVDSLIRFASLDIRHVVIDANNLCYEGRRFIRLAALEALVPILSRKHKVTLIFDAGIRRMLGLRSEEIEAKFPDAEQVHIVASRRKADETVLATAGDDPHTFVLSNDRFVDYPEKMAVKEERMLQHEIVGQVAYVHDLQVVAKFETEAV
ncbi:NYN domain-containing protein [Hydrogenophaga flava]|uniref:NYN domain-containing protein n=1 Tax=Hydrogenophaga flava TaxID=65657 RepID=UPI000A400301|nr:hypothetical protein [Hydrogenophaga flava]